MLSKRQQKKVGDNHPQHEWLSPTYYLLLCKRLFAYFIMSTERFKKASRAAPFNIPFCNKARSMS